MKNLLIPTVLACFPSLLVCIRELKVPQKKKYFCFFSHRPAITVISLVPLKLLREEIETNDAFTVLLACSAELTISGISGILTNDGGNLYEY